MCVHLCFSMRERELERDRDKASISLLPWILAGSQMKGFGYDGAAQSSPSQSQSHQNWLYTSNRVGISQFVQLKNRIYPMHICFFLFA